MTEASCALGVPVYPHFLMYDVGTISHPRIMDNPFFIFIQLLLFSVIICFLIFFPIDFSRFLSIFFLASIFEIISSSLLPSLHFNSSLSHYSGLSLLRKKKKKNSILFNNWMPGYHHLEDNLIEENIPFSASSLDIISFFPMLYDMHQHFDNNYIDFHCNVWNT